MAYIYPPELKVADGITNVVYNVTKELAKGANSGPIVKPWDYEALAKAVLT